nr:pectin acetylesterase 8-like [Ipomoea batatas]
MAIHPQWLSLVICSLVVLQTRAAYEPIPLTFPQNAEAVGAVCLDGSPPAYQLKKGGPEHQHNWLIYMEGGGWCRSVKECRARTLEHRGSSKHMMENSALLFGGILNDNPKYNPSEFRKWNVVIMRYCDGSSFIGDVEKPVENLYFRGGSAGGVSVFLELMLLPYTILLGCYLTHALREDEMPAISLHVPTIRGGRYGDTNFILMSPYDAYQMNVTLGDQVYFAVRKSFQDHVNLPAPVYQVLKG